jgi:two-component system alkaline phosphatase synthesis response regulator PhoP
VARVLVVDDELDLVRVVVKLMEGRGHRVTTAKDGVEALARVATDPPDLIILDANIPKIDGADVCSRSQGDPATRGLPIVMMTHSYVAIDEATSRIDLPCDAFVVKPFQGELLADNVDRLLRSRA